MQNSAIVRVRPIMRANGESLPCLLRTDRRRRNVTVAPGRGALRQLKRTRLKKTAPAGAAKSPTKERNKLEMEYPRMGYFSAVMRITDAAGAEKSPQG